MRENLKMLAILFRHVPFYTCTYFLNELIVALPLYVCNVLFLKVIIDSVLKGQQYHIILYYLIGLACYLIVSDALSSFFNQYIKPKAEDEINRIFYKSIFDITLLTDLSKYDDPEFYSKFLFVSQNITLSAKSVLSNYSQILAGIVNSVLVFGLFSMVGVELLIFAGCSVTLICIFNIPLNKLNNMKRMELIPIQRRQNYFCGLFFDIGAVKERKMSNIDELLKNKYDENTNELKKSISAYGGKIAFFNFIKEYLSSTILLNFGLIAFLVYQVVVEKTLQIGDFVAAYNGINVIASTATYLFGTCLAKLREDKFSIAEYLAFVSKQNITHCGIIDPPQIPCKIEFRDVSFSYPGTNIQVLKNVNLTIEPKQKVAIVGKNGAGKSTLVLLLMGLFRTQTGIILMNGVPIEHYDFLAYNKLFNSFLQNEKPLTATIAENVALDTDYNEFAVIKALKESGLTRLLDYPLNSYLGREFNNDGLMLSGGEAQKLMLAHCNYHQKAYLILDEPSSALDPFSEYEFNRHISKASSDCTTIFVSHRLSTVKLAEMIVVLEAGTIAQKGTHGELLEQNGQYKEMWEIQAKRYSTSF